MTAGRKPKPTALRLVTGNPGKRALNKREPKIDLARPMPPPFLNDDAKVEWGRVVDVLYNAGVMTAIDVAALAAYCQAYGRWSQAERAILRAQEKGELNGLLMETTNGNVIQHTLVGTANKAMQDMVRYAAEFGMTPSARSRVNATPPDGDEKDALKEFFG